MIWIGLQVIQISTHFIVTADKLDRIPATHCGENWKQNFGRTFIKNLHDVYSMGKLTHPSDYCRVEIISSEIAMEMLRFLPCHIHLAMEFLVFGQKPYRQIFNDQHENLVVFMRKAAPNFKCQPHHIRTASRVVCARAPKNFNSK